ncbi:hypothetical protein NM208_g9825 [Fusarium decemcellulare]|uniref:Uncharacterized protein n=1 Tax=Fusarium decemcellulare TaxID=57161 RepID=A0ACC1S0M5_9HYPO|nr:hypothetical protein NM208_g9825 [Fusarium decemcellulare]
MPAQSPYHPRLHRQEPPFRRFSPCATSTPPPAIGQVLNPVSQTPSAPAPRSQAKSGQASGSHAGEGQIATLRGWARQKWKRGKKDQEPESERLYPCGEHAKIPLLSPDKQGAAGRAPPWGNTVNRSLLTVGQGCLQVRPREKNEQQQEKHLPKWRDFTEPWAARSPFCMIPVFWRPLL